MPRFTLVGILVLVASLVSSSNPSLADNGTVVTGTVTNIDVVNQIMRVHVTAVNGQFINGNPQNNFVDYLVTPNTVVLNQNFQAVNQGNVLVGSNIEMEFQGPIATTIMLMGNVNNIPVVTNVVSNRRNDGFYVQSHRQNYPIIRPVPVVVPHCYPQPVHAHPVSHPVHHPSAHPEHHPHSPSHTDHPHTTHPHTPATDRNSPLRMNEHASAHRR